jgi:hypothetical protein
MHNYLTLVYLLTQNDVTLKSVPSEDLFGKIISYFFSKFYETGCLRKQVKILIILVIMC